LPSLRQTARVILAERKLCAKSKAAEGADFPERALNAWYWHGWPKIPKINVAYNTVLLTEFQSSGVYDLRLSPPPLGEIPEQKNRTCFRVYRLFVLLFCCDFSAAVVGL